MGKIKDISGLRFGQLVAVTPAGIQDHRLMWLCRCDCGKSPIINGHALRTGNTCSCGHLKSGPVKHGHARKGRRHPLYGLWAGMLSRCTNPKDSSFKNYGGRGIAVCEQWKDFASFLADMGARPGPEFTLDRRDNNSGYEPSNVQWATRKQQRNNRRDSSPAPPIG